MRLSEEQVDEFGRRGFLVLPGLFSSREVEVLRAALAPVFAEDSPANVREKLSGEVRTAMGLHVRSATYARLVRHPRLLEPAIQLLGDGLYAQQVKVNVKAAFEGEAWQWHYDFATHHREDGVPEPLALNLHVFLDDVSEFNGPLYFIPGSQRRGPVPAALDTTSTSYPLWVVGRETIAELAGAHGIVSATGCSGTALIFGDCLVHASPPNLSPWSRRIFSLIANPIANAQTSFARPDYKHHRDFTPLVPLADDCLLEAAAA
ncbi:MAG: phytanoyl-CoA dioxygenase family protein [Alphaproteobacteria bacterium]